MFFVLGLLCDSTGTAIMSTLADHSEGFVITAHGITGAIAIILMFIHAVWALLVLIKKDEQKQLTFHKFSIFVWIVWLVPYVLGMKISL